MYIFLRQFQFVNYFSESPCLIQCVSCCFVEQSEEPVPEADPYDTKYLHRLLSESDLDPNGKYGVIFKLLLFHKLIEDTHSYSSEKKCVWLLLRKLNTLQKQHEFKLFSETSLKADLVFPSQISCLELHDYCSKKVNGQVETQQITDQTTSCTGVSESSNALPSHEELNGSKRKPGDKFSLNEDDELFKKYMISRPKERLKVECSECGYTCTGKYMLRRHIYRSKLSTEDLKDIL